MGPAYAFSTTSGSSGDPIISGSDRVIFELLGHLHKFPQSLSYFYTALLIYYRSERLDHPETPTGEISMKVPIIIVGHIFLCMECVSNTKMLFICSICHQMAKTFKIFVPHIQGGETSIGSNPFV